MNYNYIDKVLYDNQHDYHIGLIYVMITYQDTTWVHPRKRGEYPASAGSTPSSGRFIPASAGSTAMMFMVIEQHRVHPRKRGEYGDDVHGYRAAQGSSPQAQGILAKPSPPRPRPRFIPASAGNTSQDHLLVLHQLVHPRKSGEYSLLKRKSERTLGSSPHTRGILIMSSFCIITIRGSSPHTRGIQQEHIFILRFGRFIPAYAGNTFGNIRLRQSRFIPAYAGNTNRSNYLLVYIRVHPRIRGEYWCRHCLACRVRGSSPHTRGILLLTCSII